MSLNALRKFLDRLLSRSALNAEERRAILSLPTSSRKVRVNHEIVSPGQTVSEACLIARGIAARFDQMADGKRQITALHLEGDMCDLHSVVCPTAAWGIIALSDAEILNIPHDELRRVAAKFPRLALAFWRDVTTDASILAKWIGNLGRRNARARVSHLLCEIGMRMEASGLARRDLFPLNISQSALADALGLTVVHVNRTLQGLRSEGLIQTTDRFVTIADFDRLASVAEFNPDYLILAKRHP